jgi:hypothetical protein
MRRHHIFFLFRFDVENYFSFIFFASHALVKEQEESNRKIRALVHEMTLHINLLYFNVQFMKIMKAEILIMIE